MNELIAEATTEVLNDDLKGKDWLGPASRPLATDVASREERECSLLVGQAVEEERWNYTWIRCLARQRSGKIIFLLSLS